MVVVINQDMSSPKEYWIDSVDFISVVGQKATADIYPSFVHYFIIHLP